MKWIVLLLMIGTFICMMIHVDDSDRKHGFDDKNKKE